MISSYITKDRSSHRAALILAIAVTLSAGLTACGSTSSKAGSATAGGSLSPDGVNVSGTPLVIGVVATDTGPAGSSNDVPTTTGIWQNWINSHGGTQMLTKVMETAAKQLLMAGVTEDFTTPPHIAAGPIASPHQITHENDALTAPCCSGSVKYVTSCIVTTVGRPGCRGIE